MPITPAPPYPKSPGDPVLSADWNQAVDEVIRLDNAKLDRAGDQVSGDLTVNGNLSVPSGNVGIGTVNPGAPLHVADHMVVGPFATTTGVGGIDVTGPLAELGFMKRTLTSWPATAQAGDRFVWYNPDGTARLWTDVSRDLLTISAQGDLTVTGDLHVPKTGGGLATFTTSRFDNENLFVRNNVKLSMGIRHGVFEPPPVYEFSIGHIEFDEFLDMLFHKRFSIDHEGKLYCAGSKAGYVVDHFVNRAGDTLSCGDVVVIGPTKEMHFSGTDNKVPIPEVDLTDKAYDTRVCGIVANVVTERNLPFVEPDREALARAQAQAEAAEKGEPGAKGVSAATRKKLLTHPLQKFAAAATEELDPTRVQDQQLGQMVTLGAFAHCKVDADIAAIEPGDLLTTSPTRGHAQKVLEPEKAIGAIIGKALTGLKKGKGIVSVLVMLQ